VKTDVVWGDLDFTGDGFGVLDVLWGDLLLGFWKAEGAEVIFAEDVGAGDGEEDAADLDVAGVFGFGECVFDAGAGLRTPADFESPTPRIFTAPSDFTSPTTMQVLLVPISSPT
jgi:hypothetical protein